METALVTLLMGGVLGYLAQRSRICFIGGLRDFLLVRDTALLKGAVAFFVTAWLAFSLAGAVGLVDWGAPAYAGQQATAVAGADSQALDLGQGLGLPVVLITLGAGIALGLFSTLANGCPTRQHVLAAQGLRDARYYIAGFYLGVIVYYLVTRPLLAYIL